MLLFEKIGVDFLPDINYHYIVEITQTGKERRESMTKTELARSMEAYVGGSFITRDELAKYMGYKAPKTVSKYLVGLEQIGKRYFVPDVADVLIAAKTYK